MTRMRKTTKMTTVITTRMTPSPPPPGSQKGGVFVPVLEQGGVARVHLLHLLLQLLQHGVLAAQHHVAHLLLLHDGLVQLAGAMSPPAREKLGSFLKQA